MLVANVGRGLLTPRASDGPAGRRGLAKVAAGWQALAITRGTPRATPALPLFRSAGAIARHPWERTITTIGLQALGEVCVELANLPRGRRRAWSRYRPWDVLKARQLAARVRDGDAVLDMSAAAPATCWPRSRCFAGSTARRRRVALRIAVHRDSAFDFRRSKATVRGSNLRHLDDVLRGAPLGARGRGGVVCLRAGAGDAIQVLLVEDSLPKFGPLTRR